MPKSVPESVPELDLIRQLGNRLGRPLQKLSEARFEQHAQEKYSARQNQIDRDAYALAADGTVSRLFLQRVTSHSLLDFPFQQFKHLKHLYLSRVNVSSFSFLSSLTGLTSLELSDNGITDCSFLSSLTGLTSLELSDNGITDCSFLSNLTGLTSLYLPKFRPNKRQAAVGEKAESLAKRGKVMNA